MTKATTLTATLPDSYSYVITDVDQALIRKALKTAIHHLRHGEYLFGGYADAQKEADQMEQLLGII